MSKRNVRKEQKFFRVDFVSVGTANCKYDSFYTVTVE